MVVRFRDANESRQTPCAVMRVNEASLFKEGASSARVHSAICLGAFAVGPFAFAVMWERLGARRRPPCAATAVAQYINCAHARCRGTRTTLEGGGGGATLPGVLRDVAPTVDPSSRARGATA